MKSDLNGDVFKNSNPWLFFWGGGAASHMNLLTLALCVFEADSIRLFQWKDVAVFVWLHHCKQGNYSH